MRGSDPCKKGRSLRATLIIRKIYIFKQNKKILLLLSTFILLYLYFYYPPLIF